MRVITKQKQDYSVFNLQLRAGFEYRNDCSDLLKTRTPILRVVVNESLIPHSFQV